jgi:hypothetical protein
MLLLTPSFGVYTHSRSSLSIFCHVSFNLILQLYDWLYAKLSQYLIQRRKKLWIPLINEKAPQSSKLVELHDSDISVF